MAETPLAKILIVDDEVEQMKALCNTLKDHGFEPTGYASPGAALDQIEEGQFDLLLTDLMMSEMDGITLLQSAQQKDPNLVGIIMTGEGTIATAVMAMKSGALDYILKPFKLSMILPVLERALTVRLLRLENARLKQQMRERAIELEAANKELEAFSYSVSHDLRAPLRHILGYIEVLNETTGLSLSKEEKECLRRINASAQEMGTLIDDLLDFSRTNRVEMRRIQVNLGDLLEDVIQRIHPDVEGRNISWQKGALPPVQGDPSLLRQVLSNLLFNAVKYTRPRNPAIIEIGCTIKPEETVIFIRDNGVGFDMEYAEKLFGVFQRLHRKEDFEGTGIGLANVRRIIARHGGRTWAEGKVDEGATFYFSLPH
jgi:two-component system sensor histidine kinase/response regulator